MVVSGPTGIHVDVEDRDTKKSSLTLTVQSRLSRIVLSPTHLHFNFYPDLGSDLLVKEIHKAYSEWGFVLLKDYGLSFKLIEKLQ